MKAMVDEIEVVGAVGIEEADFLKFDGSSCTAFITLSSPSEDESIYLFVGNSLSRSLGTNPTNLLPYRMRNGRAGTSIGGMRTRDRGQGLG